MDINDLTVVILNWGECDYDGDGMPDGWEMDWGTNPYAADGIGDLDGDGLSNVQEFNHGTDPVEVDSDGDGVSDGAEVIGGGIASRGERKTWVNTAVGLGMNGPVEREEIEKLVQWYGEGGHDAQVELCPFADDSLVKALAELQFQVKRFETVFFREIVMNDVVQALRELPGEIELRVVDARDASRTREVACVIAQGFAKPGELAREEDIRTFEACVRHRHTQTHAAYVNGECVGGGSVEIRGEIAALYGFAVAEGHRRRGIQLALMAARMNAARQAGAELVTIGGPPGMGTERNARRYGFEVGYTKVMVVRKNG